jgi:hypothetical protein
MGSRAKGRGTMTSAQGREHERLEVLVGGWRTQGWTRENHEESEWRLWMDITLTKQNS